MAASVGDIPDSRTSRNRPCELTRIASKVREYTGQPTTEIVSRNRSTVPCRRAPAAGSSAIKSLWGQRPHWPATKHAGASTKGARRNHGIPICASAGSTNLEAPSHRRRTWELRMSGMEGSSFGFIGLDLCWSGGGREGLVRSSLRGWLADIPASGGGRRPVGAVPVFAEARTDARWQAYSHRYTPRSAALPMIRAGMAAILRGDPPRRRGRPWRLSHWNGLEEPWRLRETRACGPHLDRRCRNGEGSAASLITRIRRPASECSFCQIASERFLASGS
jgi:hypothetical protein